MSTLNAIPRPLVRWNNWVTICLLVLGIIFYNPIFVGVSLVSFASGVIFGWNPIIAIAKPFLKKPFPSYIPEDKAQLRFNSTIATTMLVIALISWFADWQTGFYLFAIMTALANLGAAFGFCIGCIIRYRWMLFRKTGKLF